MSTAAALLQTIQHAPMQADQCRQQLCRDVRCDERVFSQSTSDASTLLHEEGLGVVPQPQTDCSGSTMVSAWETAAGSLCCLCCMLFCWPSSWVNPQGASLSHGWKSQSLYCFNSISRLRAESLHCLRALLQQPASAGLAHVHTLSSSTRGPSLHVGS